MRKSKALVTVILLMVTIQIAMSQHNIPYIKESITVDGKLNEEVWDRLPENTNFYNYMPTDIGLSKHQTVVKLYHDGENIYVGAIYNDTEERVQTNSLKRDSFMRFSDGFCIIFDTQNQQQLGYFFGLKAYGAQLDALVERKNDGFDFNNSWNAVWKAETSINGTQKIYEFAIPLKALNYDKDTTVFGIQMFSRDIKKNAWTGFSNVKRNFRLLDLRFTTPFTIDSLPETAMSRFAITPSVTLNYQEDLEEKDDDFSFKPSLDVQYNVTSSLKLDITINPDFSQIDVDQQVTNLSRFAVFFPERRNFFLENSDLFSNLGVRGVNPFYSRRIGAYNNIQFGLKLSGNVSPKTRIGVLNVQTDEAFDEEEEEDVAPQNYATLVVEQQLSKNFTTTGFLINRQETNGFDVKHDFNRVTGINLNFRSDNNKWTSVANYSKSFNDSLSGENTFYHTGVWFNKRGFKWNATARKLGKNYITDVGFTPRLYHYDDINDETIREGYLQTQTGVEYQKFYDASKTLNSIRYFRYRTSTFFDENGKLSQLSHFFNSALFFKDLSALYYVYKHDYINLRYGFDPLDNDNSLVPDVYRFGILRVGYNSANNQKFRYRVNVQKGKYFGGDRMSASTYLNYQLLPFANLQVSYDINSIDLKALGQETFHLTRFTKEIFFNNRLNWTTYVQYNTQSDNFNISSRFQWEYKPLSYVYLVVTDNFNKRIVRTNWGVAFKMNYRFDL